MAILVTKFLVSNDLSQIELEASCNLGETIDNIYLWTEETYKDPATKIDLSSKLASATNSESIVITAGDVNVSQLDGMYFLQIETSDDEAVIVATANFTQYYIIQAKLVANVDLSCLNCNANFQNAQLFDMYLEATKNSMILGRFQDAIDNLKNLIISIDTDSCDECKDIPALVSTAGNIVSVGVIDCLLTEV